MRKLFAPLVLALGISSLTGCILAPQAIQLNETSQVAAVLTPPTGRGALVRVVDQREMQADHLGSRGGRLAENSPLVAQDELAAVLTRRLQDSMTQLGFGEGSFEEPVRLQLDIEKFRYSCNDGFVVTDCSVKMKFAMTVYNGDTTFTKPYGLNESRRVAAAPVQEYNEKWMTDTLDRLWSYIFNDPELRSFLGI